MLIVLFYRPFQISIHALREEGDLPGVKPATLTNYFYPRPPRPYSVTFVFLSTPSARRATVTAQRRIEEVRISIHALREEGDSRLSMMRCTSLLFLSTPSARRATKSAKI